MNSQDLAAQVVGIPCSALCIPVLASLAFVYRIIIARVVGVRVIAHGNKKISVGSEGQRSSGMTALLSLCRNFDQNLFRERIEAVAVENKPRHPLNFTLAGRRIKKIYKAIVLELRIQRYTQ